MHQLTSMSPASILGISTESWPAWLVDVVAIVLVLVVASLVLWLVRRTIQFAARNIVQSGSWFRRRARRILSGPLQNALPDTAPLAAARRTQRAETMASVFTSVAVILVALGVVTAILTVLDVNTGSLFATAGIAGVALGFGAQTLVKDYLAGVSMLAEDQYGIGDVVDLGVASGTVEQVGLRVTQVRDLEGTLWFVRNGEILRVGNRTQGWSRAVVDVRVAAGADLVRVQDALNRAAANVARSPELGSAVLGDPDITGIEDFSADQVLLKVLVKTAPSRQWDVARALRSQIRAVLAKEGIAMAVPQREVLVPRTPPAAAAAEDDDAPRGGA